MPVSADPSIAGNTDGNLASGIVPDDRLLAFNDPIIEDVTYPHHLSVDYYYLVSLEYFEYYHNQ